ncbi:hypothetical protein PIB30_113970, partial [Stylosanthes scabra]|nr:hypothetical protein [Stylosanthes scabra]
MILTQTLTIPVGGITRISLGEETKDSKDNTTINLPKIFRDSNHSLHLHLLKNNQVILKKPSQRWLSTLTHSWMKQEQISRIRKLQLGIWKS